MINLEEYSAKKRSYLKQCEASCIYVITNNSMTPTKIGISNDICARFASIQSSNWSELFVEFLMWFPGKEASFRVEQNILSILKSDNISGEWFNLDAGYVSNVVRIFSKKLYPTLYILTHLEMITLLIGKNIEEDSNVLTMVSRPYAKPYVENKN